MVLFSYDFFKSILFQLEPEKAHKIAGVGLKMLSLCPPLFKHYKKKYFVNDAALHQNILGIEFKNPVGLAAGFDKDGEYIDSIVALGFGYSEIGTVTPRPQEGNAKPRLFRLKEEQSIQNAMGFNNRGSEFMLQKVNNRTCEGYPIGINIGKNKTTSQEDALSDYEFLLETFESHASYLVINISSPNTPGLRDLQNEAFITELFTMAQKITTKPIFLKIAPDMEAQDAIALCGVAINAGASGIIATNTTVDYTLSDSAKDFGGISGKLLKEKSFKLFEAIAKVYYGKTILISVGGIDCPLEAYRRIKAGASLVQVYSMLIYDGPELIKDINFGLTMLLKEDGYKSITEAIGADRADD
ncbi:MAG: quinone-dependent dihydroorotate dehydrogenase [Campylobacterales bacterium]|nr:quinone-dependent dihydroorotate dehydrogenase [Campylobacterales bacterium]